MAKTVLKRSYTIEYEADIDINHPDLRIVDDVLYIEGAAYYPCITFHGPTGRIGNKGLDKYGIEIQEVHVDVKESDVEYDDTDEDDE